ncbi:MAG: hypothetical protein ABSG64_00615 [Solirubrobacteraceae bacterium]
MASQERPPSEGNHAAKKGAPTGRRRRWLLALDPIFEAGRQNERARNWDVEEELVAVAFLGDVAIDLSQAKSIPADVFINAFAVVRDVDVLVAEGVHVELFGDVFRGELSNDVPAVPEGSRDRVVRIHGHALLGDVTVRAAL